MADDAAEEERKITDFTMNELEPLSLEEYTALIMARSKWIKCAMILR
jgi:hypothetical protein